MPIPDDKLGWLAGLAGVDTWSPLDLAGVEHVLPLAEGAGATVQQIPDLVSGAAAVYRGDDGTIEGADPAWVAEGLAFTASQNDRCNIGTPYLGSGTAKLTVMVAAAFDTSTAAHRVIYAEGNNLTTVPVMFLRRRNGGGQLNLLYRNDAGGLAQVDSTGTTYNDEVYRTYAFRLDEAGTMEIFVNGVSDSGAVALPGGVATLDTAYLGLWASTGAYYGYQNIMSYVVVVTDALSDTNIKYLHNWMRGQVASRGIVLPLVA